MSLNRNEDTFIFEADISGETYSFEIAYTLSDDCIGSSDEPVRGVESWRVHKINGAPNMLGAFWSEQLNAEAICDAILEEVA